MRRNAIVIVCLVLALLLAGCQSRSPSAESNNTPETGAPAGPAESSPAAEETGSREESPEVAPSDDAEPEKTLEDFVSEAIIDYYKTSFYRDEIPLFPTEYHETIGTVEEDGTVSVYMVALYAQYQYAKGELVLTGAVCTPMAVTFLKEEDGGYTVLEFWEAQDGSRYEASIREKFPPEMAEAALERMSLGLDRAMEICAEKARAYFEGQGA